MFLNVVFLCLTTYILQNTVNGCTVTISWTVNEVDKPLLPLLLQKTANGCIFLLLCAVNTELNNFINRKYCNKPLTSLFFRALRR